MSTEIALAVPYLAKLALVTATVFVFVFVILVRAFVFALVHVIFGEIWALIAEVIVTFVMCLDVILKVLSGRKLVGTNRTFPWMRFSHNFFHTCFKESNLLRL